MTDSGKRIAGSGKPPKDGRKAFRGMAPEGYRIRVMEPGEAPRLRGIYENAIRDLAITRGIDDRCAVPDMAHFIEFLVSHDVFVAAEKASGEAVGFAAAVAETDLYWIATMVVDEAHRGKGVGSALLGSMTQRSEWFFYRALGLSAYGDRPDCAAFYERFGFLRVPRSDLPKWLDEKRTANGCESEASDDRIVLLRWL